MGRRPVLPAVLLFLCRMPADKYLQARAQAGTALFVLSGITAELRVPGDLPARVNALVHRIREPLRFAVIGAPDCGKSTLLDAVFGIPFTTGAGGGGAIHVYRHVTDAPSPESPPPGVKEFRLPHAFLRDFTVIDAPGVRGPDSVLSAHMDDLILESDVLIVAFSAGDPWNAEAWGLLQRNRDRFRSGAVLVLLQCDLLAHDEQEGVVRYFQQTARRKLGAAFHSIVALSHPAEDNTGLGALSAAVDTAIGSTHPRHEALVAAASEGASLCREAVAAARKGLEDLRHDEREAFALERSLLTQYGWLRRELHERLAAAAAAGRRQLLDAGLRFAACIGPTRLDLLAHDRESLARELQEDLTETLRSELVPQMDDAAARFEMHLEESWQALFSRLQPRFIEELKGSATAFPHLREAHGALSTRVELDLRNMFAGEDVPPQVRDMLGQAAAMNLQPFAIILASVLAAALAAFQGGCEIAGGMIFAVGLVATGWSIFAGANLRKLLRSHYRQLCEFKLQELLVRLRERLEGFAEEILEEIGRKLKSINETAYAARSLQEPLVEKAMRVADTLDGLIATLRVREETPDIPPKPEDSGVPSAVSRKAFTVRQSAAAPSA